MSWQDAKNAGTEVPEQDFAGFMKLTEPGQFVVGKVTALKDNQYGRYLQMERRDGARFNVGVTTYLDNNYKVAELVGQVVAIGFEEERDTGEASPMKILKVVQYGGDFPEIEGMEADEDLPF